MGGEIWDYFVPYEDDVQSALNKLRKREFAAGRFYPSHLDPATIELALELSEDNGTQSILDIERIADEPDYSAAAPFRPEDLKAVLGTDRPTRSIIEENVAELCEFLDRGQGIYVVAYKDDRPSEIFFGGCSYD